MATTGRPGLHCGWARSRHGATLRPPSGRADQGQELAVPARFFMDRESLRFQGKMWENLEEKPWKNRGQTMGKPSDKSEECSKF